MPVALVDETINFAYATGSPTDATDWDEVDWQFGAENIKLIATVANVDFSMNGVEVHGTIFAGEELNFQEMRRGKMWFRGGATAVLRLWAWTR